MTTHTKKKQHFYSGMDSWRAVSKDTVRRFVHIFMG